MYYTWHTQKQNNKVYDFLVFSDEVSVNEVIEKMGTGCIMSILGTRALVAFEIEYMDFDIEKSNSLYRNRGVFTKTIFKDGKIIKFCDMCTQNIKCIIERRTCTFKSIILECKKQSNDKKESEYEKINELKKYLVEEKGCKHTFPRFALEDYDVQNIFLIKNNDVLRDSPIELNDYTFRFTKEYNNLYNELHDYCKNCASFQDTNSWCIYKKNCILFGVQSIDLGEHCKSINTFKKNFKTCMNFVSLQDFESATKEHGKYFNMRERYSYVGCKIELEGKIYKVSGISEINTNDKKTKVKLMRYDKNLKNGEVIYIDFKTLKNKTKTKVNILRPSKISESCMFTADILNEKIKNSNRTWIEINDNVLTVVRTKPYNQFYASMYDEGWSFVNVEDAIKWTLPPEK